MSYFENGRLFFLLLVTLFLFRLINGKSDGKLTPRIVGGRQAKLGEMPCVLAVQDNVQGIESHCTYCLINEQTAIGCAHCVYDVHRDKKMAILYLVGGAVDRRTGEKLKIKDVKIHEKFTKSTMANDISLIILEKPVKTNSNLQPALLLMSGEKVLGETAKVAGWGYSEYGNKHTANLLQVSNVKILPPQECRDFKPYFKSEYNLCAGSKDSGIAMHDSGSPLIISEGQRQILVGILSLSYHNKTGFGKPAQYMKINGYIPWIQKRVHGTLRLYYISSKREIRIKTAVP